MSNGNDSPPTPWPKDPPNGIPISRKDDDGAERDAGFVHRGTKTINGKPHIYMWFTQSRQSQKKACEEDAIYSFEEPSVTLATSAGSWDVTAKAKKDVKGAGGGDIKTTIGGTLVWGEPSPDYDPEWVKKQNEQRRKQHKKLLPPVKRPSAKPGEKVGYPYSPRKIPGTPDEGFEDAPDFSANNFATHAVIRLLRKSKNDPKNPSGFPAVPDHPAKAGSFQATLTIRVHYSTLLYCLDPFGCLGWFEWDFVETDVFTIETFDQYPPMGDFITTATPVSSSKTVTIGPWKAC